MREVIRLYVERRLTRRAFMKQLTAAGISAASARAIARELRPLLSVEAVPQWARKRIAGTGGELLAEQLIASGVRYVFGNSGSGDAGFYEALVDRPQLRYVLVLHEGPLAAMAAGYAKASGQPAYLCVAGAAGLANIIGQMFNAHKERTPLVCVAYKRESSLASGRDVFEELAGQEDLVAPLSKWRWIATRAETIPEIVRRAFKIAQTPPWGPVYLGWTHDLLLERAEAEIVSQSAYDLPLRIRPAARDVEEAAKLLLEAANPILIVGDEVYKAHAAPEVVRLAELIGAVVTTTPREGFSNFPESHPLFVGLYSANMRFPETQDVVLNVGARIELLATSSKLPIPSEATLIDMRLDSGEIGKVFPTRLPLVCHLKVGLADLLSALESRMTPTLRERARERFERTRAFTESVRRTQHEVVRRGRFWDSSPLAPARLSYEISRLAESDALVVVESAETFGFDFDPIAGRTYIAFRGGHLGSGVGGAAGVKMARPNQQVILLIGDGSFLFGPQALWTMVRMEIPVIIVVFNNRSYNSVKDRTLAMIPTGRMRETGQMVHYYIGAPDVDMVRIAEGFGVRGEKVTTPQEIGPAWQRAVAATRDGRPYLIDAHVARTGAWAENPWYPQFSIAGERERRV